MLKKCLTIVKDFYIVVLTAATESCCKKLLEESEYVWKRRMHGQLFTIVKIDEAV